MHLKMAKGGEEVRLKMAKGAGEVRLKTVEEAEEAHLRMAKEGEGEHSRRATEVEEGHSIEAMAVAEERWTVEEAEEVVHSIVEGRCLLPEVEAQVVKRQAVMEDQRVSWEAKEVEVHSLEEQHEHVLLNLFAEFLVEGVVEELLLCLVSEVELAFFGP